MRSELIRKILKRSAHEQEARPIANEFEMAYQSRIAIDRIRARPRPVTPNRRAESFSACKGLHAV